MLGLGLGLGGEQPHLDLRKPLALSGLAVVGRSAGSTQILPVEESAELHKGGDI